MSEDAGGVFKAPALPPNFVKPSPKTVEEKQENVIKAPELPPPSDQPADEEKPEISAKKEQGQSKPIPDTPPLNYTPPEWACAPEPGRCYKLEILKNGIIADVSDMAKRKNSSFVVIGRLPVCDVVMDHPSISRYHCILQYGDDKMTKKGKGWYIYDMGSTHGSKMNKNRLPPKQFIRVQVGFVFQFGGSSRIVNLLGPPDDADPEWECSPTEMREKMRKKALEAKLAAVAKKEYEEEKEREKQEEEGCGWGMDYGDEEGAAPMFDLEGHLAEDGEAYYNADPKKALAKFFERVGFDMNFMYSESGQGHTHKWTCSIELPVEIDGVDRAFTAQAVVSTSKKDATVQCALEACKILDRHNVLRSSNTRLRMKKKTLEDNDYYDEDDDLFFDRTGQLEAQREKRKIWALKAAGKMKEETDTYETLTVKLKATRDEMAEVQKELDQLGHKGTNTGEKAVDVDDYMTQLAKGTITLKDDMQTKMHKSALRQKLVSLTHEAQTLEKLVKIAKPVSLPEFTAPSAASASKQAFLRKMMQFGNVKKELMAVGEKVEVPKTEKTTNEEKTLDKKPIEPAQPPQTSEAIKEPIATVEKAVAAPPAKSQQKAASADRAVKPEKAPDDTSVPTTSRPPLDEQPASEDSELDAPAEKKKESEERKRIANTEPEAEKVIQKKRKPRVQKEKQFEEYGAGCEAKDEQYATWMPPENQSGDGKTALHEKFAGRY